MLLSVIGVLIVTEIMILGLFVLTIGRTFKHHFKEKTISKLIVFQDIIQKKIDAKPDTPLYQRKDISEFIGYFSSLLDVDIWLVSRQGDVMLKTPGSRPYPEEIDEKNKRTINKNIIISFESRRHLDFLTKIPIQLGNGGPGDIYVQYKERKIQKPEGFFLVGLLIIAVVIAILVAPLSRLFTRRVNVLNDSALRLADGDFSYRPQICGHDEIAKLGQSFNFMADKIEKMIHKEKELTANISHELRSPLARIRVSKELLQDQLDKGDTSGLKPYLISIEDDIQMLDKLIGDILKLSKTDLLEAAMISKPVDISGILTDLLKTFKPAMDQHGLVLAADIQEKLISVGDKEGLYSVFSNIFDNAVKYTIHGGKIQVKASNMANKRIVILVANTSGELTPGVMEKIFDPFFRGHHAMESGSGLGLCIAKKIIDKHSGSIVAENTQQEFCLKIELIHALA